MTIKQVRIRLTFLYSLLFLCLFWLLSLGIYVWVNHFFQEQYEHEVKQQYSHEVAEHDSDANDQRLTEIAESIALDHLGMILLVLNGGLLIFVPASAWLLTGKSLEPVEEAHTREKQFVANVAHDLRTPLTILSTEIEVALRKERPAHEYKKLAISNKEEIDRLSVLVKDLLFLARQDAHIDRQQLELVDLTDTISRVTARYNKVAKQKKLSLLYVPPKIPQAVLGNQTMLEQLFVNLLDNAIKYTTRGKITITATRDNNVAVIAMRDTGIGMRKDDMAKIFDRFSRVDKARSQTKGYGLGLAIVQTIVKIHRGTIKVSSTYGSGSVFTVKLPLTTRNRGKNLL